jgi:glycerophosphoryl diester phosphodiesterase
LVSIKRRVDLDRLIAAPFAHRGLHGCGLIENSRAAFEAAIVIGHGIELDVQASFNREAHVFHDHNLDRLTQASGAFAHRTSHELRSLRFRDCNETVPTLREVLGLIAGKVSLLVEIKASHRTLDALCLDIFRALEGYPGSVGVMSYHPRVGEWFSRYAPQQLRGLVIRETGHGALRKPFFRQSALRRASPDFLAYRIADLPSGFAAVQREKGLRILAWTCRSLADRARAAEHADQIIYETPTK